MATHSGPEPRIIKDCLYRFIQLCTICNAFVDTPEFQRLRRIKQTGLAPYVFPASVHTRFEHSLGVMHLAGQLADRLGRTADGGPSITPRQRTLVQLAGLLHDAGHLAYSHTFDDVLAIRRAATGTPRASKRHDDVPLHHEDRSIAVLRRINGHLHLLRPEEEEVVAEMIHGTIPEGTHTPWLFQIVSNAECGLDVDRMDYLQRDAYHAGLPGLQPDYLIRKALVGDDGRIVWSESARHDIRNLYETRARMFATVYHNATVVCAERLILCALLRWLPHAMDEDTYLSMDDVLVEAALRTDPATADLMHALDTRQFEHACEHCSGVDTLYAERTVPESIDDQMARVRFV